MPSTQGKHWVFTINNYTADDEQRLRDLATTESVVHLIFGRETGAQGTPHLQGFVSFATRVSFGPVKAKIGQTAHVERAVGTPQQASTYCKKDEDFEEFGVVPGGAGQRTDLIIIRDKLKSGESLTNIADEHFGTYLRFERSIKSLRSLWTEPRTWETINTVYYGATGVGKTRKVYTIEANLENLYVHPGGPWFDGYDSQEAVLFDDFGGHEFKLTYLLKLLDRYPMRVPVKGSFVQWVPKRIYMTSNIEPMYWYRNALDQHVAALLRRINTIELIE